MSKGGEPVKGRVLPTILLEIRTQKYGRGYSARNLWDMKRFYSESKILQPLPAESHSEQIRQTVSDEFTGKIEVREPQVEYAVSHRKRK